MKNPIISFGLRAVLLCASCACLAMPLSSAAQQTNMSVGTTYSSAASDLASTAFYYANKPPIDELSQFDRIIVEPLNVNQDELRALRQHGGAIFAYLSVGEIAEFQRPLDQIPPDWIVGSNNTWNSHVVDLTNPWVQRDLIKQVDRLVQQGYDGLFLDTLDSYQLYAGDADARQQQESALADIISQIHSRKPGMRLIANRGFEVLDRTGHLLEAVAAESLYESWNHAKRRYQAVNSNDRQWLLNQLTRAHDQFDLDVIAIDYVAPQQRAKARETAQKIAAHGFVPWVANPELDYVGISSLEVISRRVLLIYDSLTNGPLHESDVHDLIAAPLEYMGYVPVYHDVRTDGVPVGRMAGRYAGIVAWNRVFHEIPGVQQWLAEQIGSGIKVALFGNPGMAIDAALAERMGIEVLAGIDSTNMKVSHQDNFIGFETEPQPRIDGFALNARNVSNQNSVHLSYSNPAGENIDVVLSGPWGGYAFSPAAKDLRVDQVPYWIVDPFKFLRRSLDLRSIPMPDVTTENGRRLWLAHIDGDALPSWAEMPGRKLGAEIIDDEILQRYPLPHTVSVVEAEMTSLRAVDDRHDRMHAIAKKIFARDNVEIATHTFSHPYAWGDLKPGDKSGVFNLDVRRYFYDVKREISGSADFIDRQLAPAGKRTRVLLWSGDALPGADALQEAKNRRLINMNGGGTVISEIQPVLSMVSPMARTVGDHVQAYAPIMNENVYTNDWTGPYYGFHRVIETMTLTEHPRRLKPINIYYHFYAGTKAATMRALREIYDWTLEQDIHPVYVSEYARKVPDFRDAGVARYLDGRWKVSGLGDIRSLRIVDSSRQWPVIENSVGVVGAKQLHDGMYLHTNGADQLTFYTSQRRPALPHLVSSNGRLLNWNSNSGQLRFRVHSHVPASVEIGGAGTRLCNIKSNGKVINGTRTGTNTLLFQFNSKDTGDAVLDCQT